MLATKDFTYIDNYEQYVERVKRYEKGVYKQGREEGREEGRNEGIEIGIEQERQNQLQEKLLMAKQMKQKGFDIETIAEITNLTKQQIENI